VLEILATKAAPALWLVPVRVVHLQQELGALAAAQRGHWRALQGRAE